MAKTFDDKKIIYTMDRVTRAYGTKVVLKDVSISYYYGAKIGVIGPNGSGKSSLFKILAGKDTDFSGETTLAPGFTIGYLEQEPELTPGKTVMETVKEGVKEITDLLAEFDQINEAFGDPDADIDKLCARQGEVQEKLDALDAWNLDNNLELAMDALRCPPADQVVDVLSGGERRRVALCRLLLQKPDILLLDEPTNHLDAETVAWLEKHLHDYPGTVIAVTHDRYLMKLPAGFWNLTAAKAIRLRVTIQAGLNRRQNACALKTNLNLTARKKFSANWTGFTWVQKDARQSTRNTLHATTNL